ncbi:MAG TPA: PCYCGC motif-containing (lipo)protein [Anaerolineae bacterium]
MKIRRIRLLFPLLAALLVLSGLTTGCSGGSAATQHALKMAPLSDLPAEVQSAPVAVHQAYQFAVANPDVMQHIPCYCGCGAMGHASNYACYVAGQNPDGSTQFDPHALGCSICVDITQDAMRLLKQGTSVTDIRAYVDNTYSRFGPSNMPQP